MHGEGTTVYVLGAGCSASAGFPLARNFRAALEEFGHSLGTGANQIKKCVTHTVELLSRKRIITLDDLSHHILDGTLDDERTGPVTNFGFQERSLLWAKISIAAFFLYLEQRKDCDLERYEDFVWKVFGDSGSWRERARASHVRILNFNYDRLFEQAFRNRLSKQERGYWLLYGKDLLNSGFHTNIGLGFEIGDGFCYLKMHGSTGMRVERRLGTGIVRYCPENDPFDESVAITDEQFENAFSRHAEPLIVFPGEKAKVRDNPKATLVYADYIKAVWQKAGEVISTACTIHVIGYSFNFIDPELAKLLQQASSCQKIIIQNRPEHIGPISRKLRQVYHIETPIEACPEDF